MNPSQPKSEAFIRGFQEAERHYYANGECAFEPEEAYPNPFAADTEEWTGYEEAVYIFTNK